jgi:hypothetical protein
MCMIMALSARKHENEFFGASDVHFSDAISTHFGLDFGLSEEGFGVSESIAQHLNDAA